MALLSGYVYLKVIGEEEVRYCVKHGSTLGKMMIAYAAKIGVDVWSVKFIYEGRSLKRDDTPRSLSMKDNDVIEVVKDTTEDPSGNVRLKVIGATENNDLKEIHILMNLSTAMGKLKSSYSSSVGVSIDDLRFLHYGRRIKDEDTPWSLGMKENDVVEVFKDTDTSSANMRLKVIGAIEGSNLKEVHFLMKQSTPLGKLKLSYSEKVGVSLGHLRFLQDGRRIKDEDTPRNLSLQNDDFIFVYKELFS